MRGASVILTLGCAVALGGCQSLFGESAFASRSAKAEPEGADLSEYFAQRLEAGRTHLRLNRPTQAIVAFRQASYDPAHAGAAYNGMGVAYAQLGRADLATRYFQLAVSADPQDERFARNLARLEWQSAAGEMNLARATQSAIDAAGLADEASMPQPSKAAPGDSPMVRVSDKEVRVVSGAAAAVSGVSVSAEAMPAEQKQGARVQVLARNGSSIRAQAAAPSPRPSGYPVRIALADVKQTYPVRIELPEAR